MITTKDLWMTLDSKKKREKIEEALLQLKAIDQENSPLKDKPDHGRLANVRTDLERFIINACAWESDIQLQRHY